MKKIIINQLLILFLICSHSSRSHAIVGGAQLLVGGSSNIAVAGAVFSVVGYLTSGLKNDGPKAMTIFGGVLLVLGLIILDEENQHLLAYGELREEERKELGVSDHIAEVFNGQLEEVNAIHHTIIDEIEQMENPSLQEATRLWGIYGEGLAHETKLVLENIALNFQRANSAK
jgi:hypothetical protein